MRIQSRLMWAALAVAIATMTCTAAAQASRSVELSGFEGISRVRAVSRQFTFTDSNGTFAVVCEVTVGLSFHSAIAKSQGALAGWVREGSVRACRGGTARLLAETMPWHIHYDRITGTLPSITTVSFVAEVAFLIEAFFGIAKCLYTGGAWPLTGRGRGTQIERFGTEGFATIPLYGSALGSVSCPAQGMMQGQFDLDPWLVKRLL